VGVSSRLINQKRFSDPFPEKRASDEFLFESRKKAPKENKKKKENNPEHFESWDLGGSLKAWTTTSNRNLHSVVGMIPLMTINLRSSEEIERVHENTRNYYAKRFGSSQI